MKMHKIDHLQIKNALMLGSKHLDRNKCLLDNLNVFPVPDGDTGTNMSGTLGPAVSTFRNKTIKNLNDITRDFLPYLNENSRGNSGFIISSFFKGFFEDLKDFDTLDIKILADCFRKGAYQVNISLFNPLPGTMVTVIEAITQKLQSAKNEDVLKELEQAIEYGREILFKTPQMLPTLARAGVVDSGALGFLIIMEGFLAGLKNESLEKIEKEEDYRMPPHPEIVDDFLLQENQKQYCTELTIQPEKKVNDQEIHEYLTEYGNSIALSINKEAIKLHIHTDFPEKIIEYMKRIGPIKKRKVEDMQEQVLKTSGNPYLKNCSNTVLLISPGKGFTCLLEEIGVEHILTYDKHLPTVKEVMDSLNEISEDGVIILPNNSNILPTCMAAREKSPKEVSIIPTSNVIQGISCFYGYSENNSINDNIKSMQDCKDLSDALFVYKSSDNRSYSGHHLSKDDFFVLHNKKIICVDKELSTAVLKALKQMNLNSFGSVTFFHKQQRSSEMLNNIKQKILNKNKELTIEIHYGGQNQADLIIALE